VAVKVPTSTNGIQPLPTIGIQPHPETVSNLVHNQPVLDEVLQTFHLFRFYPQILRTRSTLNDSKISDSLNFAVHGPVRPDGSANG
jgi:hypothetical protein